MRNVRDMQQTDYSAFAVSCSQLLTKDTTDRAAHAQPSLPGC
jgi:hypothetical protein